MELKETIKWKTINIRLDSPYTFWTGFRQYLERGLDNWFTKWYFKSKWARHVVGVWYIEEKKGWFEKYFISAFK